MVDRFAHQAQHLAAVQGKADIVHRAQRLAAGLRKPGRKVPDLHQRFGRDLFALTHACRRCRQQLLRIGMLRMLEDRVAIAAFYHAAVLHNDNLVCDIGDHGQVVTDEKHADVPLFSQLGNQPENLCLQRDVERGCGLVRDKQRRLVDERHGNHHALAHAAGKLVRVVVYRGVRIANADFFEARDSALAGLALAYALVQPQGFHDLLADGHVGVEAGHRVLEDHRNIPAPNVLQRALGQLQQVAPPECRGAGLNGARRLRYQTEQAVTGNGFARAGFADNRRYLAGVDTEVDIVHRARDAVARGETDRKPLDVQHCHRVSPARRARPAHRAGRRRES